PWKLIGQLVDIRATATMVQIFHHGELVKTHVRKGKGKVTNVADYPPEKIAFHTRTRSGAAIGPSRPDPRPPR
ncbi:Mu transposase domain-containing protein, partial [Plantactinospora mayteni]